MNRISVITLVTMAIISSLAAATSVLRDSDDDVIHDHLVQMINNVTYDVIELQTAVDEIKRQHHVMRNDGNKTKIEERKGGRVDQQRNHDNEEYDDYEQDARLDILRDQIQAEREIRNSSIIQLNTKIQELQVSVDDDTAAKNRKDVTVEDLVMQLISYVTTDLKLKTHSATERVTKTDIDDLKAELKKEREARIQLEARSSSKVAFVAKVKTTTSYTAGSAIKFDEIITNIGNAYNATTGLFIAPVDGLYYFTMTIYSSSAAAGASLRQNNMEKCAATSVYYARYIYRNTHTTAIASDTCEVVLSLTRKEIVNVVKNPGDASLDAKRSSFTGFLLSVN